MTLDQFLARLLDVVVNPLIRLIFAAALVFFLWGVLMYLKNSDDDAERTKGRSHMLWGVIGMAIMVGVFGILEIVTRTILGG